MNNVQTQSIAANREQGIQAGLVDPGFLEIIGALTEALGLAEHLQKLFPLDRMRMKRRHQRIEAQRRKCKEGLTDARVALNSLKSFAERHMGGIMPGTFGVAVPAGALPVYRGALGQLQVAIHQITNATYELEVLTRELPSDHEDYFRISEGGRKVLSRISAFLAEPGDGLAELISLVELELEKAWRKLDSDGESNW